MAGPVLRRAHGRSAAIGRITASECLPVDELPDGEPADAHVESPTDRGPSGHFAPGNSLAAKGGRARAGRTALGSTLGVPDATDQEEREAMRRADAFRKAQCAALASTVGGGFCGPGPSSIIASASLALAGSRLLYARAGGDPKVLLVRTGGRMHGTVTGVEVDGVGRPRKDTEQVTFRVPTSWLTEADEIAELLTRPGMEATRTDAFRAAIARGFAVIREEHITAVAKLSASVDRLVEADKASAKPPKPRKRPSR